MQQLTQKPLAMLRWMKMRGGTVACSGFQTWIKMKAIKSTKANTNNAMIRPSLHYTRSASLGQDSSKNVVDGTLGPKLTLYVKPPHCRARHKQITPGRRASRPSIFSCCSLCFRVSVVSERSGTRSKKKTNTMTTPPKGRLM